MNGAAARTCQEGDEVIVATSIFGEIDDMINRQPKVLVFGENNIIIDRITYKVFRQADGKLDMVVTSAKLSDDYGFPASLTRSS